MNTPITLAPAIASSISLTDDSRATASGMNEFGNSTVSRSGSTGTSPGTVYERSPAPGWTTRGGLVAHDLSFPTAHVGAGGGRRRLLTPLPNRVTSRCC